MQLNTNLKKISDYQIIGLSGFINSNVCGAVTGAIVKQGEIVL